MQTVFIVDDHAPVIRVMRLALEAAEFRVVTARDGSECLAALQNEHPDFLVTDIDMPRMSGKELCQEIETQFPGRQFPIVVITSRTELEHRHWTRNIPNLWFMEKPVSVRRLIELIRQLLTPEPENVSVPK